VFCLKCGTQLPDDAVFCYRCGTKQSVANQQSTGTVLAPSTAVSLKCPSCGAPITPKFGEMVVTCEYCGSSIALGSDGWKSIQKHTMLTPTITSQEDILKKIHDMMDRGLLHRHLQENSKLEELGLLMVPYWVIPVSARTTVVAADVVSEVGKVAATAALAGILGSALEGRRQGGFSGGVLDGVIIGTVLSGSNQAPQVREYRMDGNYNYPVIALKSLSQYQPLYYEFNLGERKLFDFNEVKQLKVLNGDIGEETAKYQAKTLVDQLQSNKAHAQYHMIRSISTDIDVGEGELLHAPVWFARYDHKGNKIILVLDANSGGVIYSFGL
jgi:DNA-directed RNA polymerase subunit RPC12/RpoP